MYYKLFLLSTETNVLLLYTCFDITCFVSIELYFKCKIKNFINTSLAEFVKTEFGFVKPCFVFVLHFTG